MQADGVSWLNWMTAMPDWLLGFCAGVGALGFALFLWARYSQSLRSVWLSTVGTRVKFAVDIVNDPHTIPPHGWSHAFVRVRRKKTVLSFDGYDLRGGCLKVVVPLDCTIRTRSRSAWASNTTQEGHVYATAKGNLGINKAWPYEVDLWLLFDPDGGVTRRDAVARAQQLVQLSSEVD